MQAARWRPEGIGRQLQYLDQSHRPCRYNARCPDTETSTYDERKDCQGKVANPRWPSKADIHELYEESVQNVENEVQFLQNDVYVIFADRSNRSHTLREDFLWHGESRPANGLSRAWTYSGDRRRYRCVSAGLGPTKPRQSPDDRRPGKRVKTRLNRMCSTVETPQVDILVGFQFQLLDLRGPGGRCSITCAAAAPLVKDDGLLFCDMFGGLRVVRGDQGKDQA